MIRCPICARPSDAGYRPFCSRRCADVDLAHWLRGDYAIPAEPAGDMTGHVEVDQGDGDQDGS